MAIEVRIPTILRTYTGGEKAVNADGASLTALIDDLEANHPGIKDRLIENGDLRRFVNVYVNDEDVRFIGGLEAELKRRRPGRRAPRRRRRLSRVSARRTFVLVDGENIDATLGNSLLGRRPDARGAAPLGAGHRLRRAAPGDQPVTGLFFLNATNGNLPTSFVQALLAMDYRPIPLAGDGDEKVVDVGIQRTLDALARTTTTPTCCSPATTPTSPRTSPRSSATGRRVGLIGLREYMSTQLTGLGIPLFDLEDDVHAFNQPLPRVRIIPLAEFDPERFLR